tara:strand:+ start:220 stop:774 length:555 start_codon:yes stop_codon:yes gene_type:complete
VIQIKPLNNFYIHSQFPNHNSLKKDLLSKINNAYGGKVSYDKTSVDIYRCDWDKRNDDNREWVQYIAKDLKKHFINCFSEAGYDEAFLIDLWYQQYNKNSQHGWHIHGNNFTGVYYVDLPNNAYKTEYINPLDKNDIRFFDVQEGDLILFPSHLVHRAPVVKDDIIKTIISFNLDVGYPDKKGK